MTHREIPAIAISTDTDPAESTLTINEDILRNVFTHPIKIRDGNLEFYQITGEHKTVFKVAIKYINELYSIDYE